MGSKKVFSDNRFQKTTSFSRSCARIVYRPSQNESRPLRETARAWVARPERVSEGRGDRLCAQHLCPVPLPRPSLRQGVPPAVRPSSASFAPLRLCVNPYFVQFVGKTRRTTTNGLCWPAVGGQWPYQPILQSGSRSSRASIPF